MMACACLLRALDKVGPDPQKIRDALEEIDDFTEAVTKMKPHPFSHAQPRIARPRHRFPGGVARRQARTRRMTCACRRAHDG